MKVKKAEQERVEKVVSEGGHAEVLPGVWLTSGETLAEEALEKVDFFRTFPYFVTSNDGFCEGFEDVLEALESL